MIKFFCGNMIQKRRYFRQIFLNHNNDKICWKRLFNWRPFRFDVFFTCCVVNRHSRVALRRNLKNRIKNFDSEEQSSSSGLPDFCQNLATLVDYNFACVRLLECWQNMRQPFLCRRISEKNVFLRKMDLTDRHQPNNCSCTR
jgi:hypothetical protein